MNERELHEQVSCYTDFGTKNYVKIRQRKAIFKSMTWAWVHTYTVQIQQVYLQIDDFCSKHETYCEKYRTLQMVTYENLQ